MALKGSITERSTASELRQLQEFFFNYPRIDEIIRVLKTVQPKLDTVFLLSCCPDDGEDCMTLLVNASQVVEMEIDALGTEPSTIEHVESLLKFQSGRRKMDQIRIAIALDMLKRENK